MVVAAFASFASFVLNGLRATVGTLGLLPFRIKFLVVWVVALLFLLFNASTIYGAEAPRFTTILLLYMVAIAFIASQTRQPNPLIGVSTADFLITFTIWVLLSAAVFKLIAPFNPERAVLSSASIAILVTHALVVAIGEEFLFRYAIPSLLPPPAFAQQTISAVLFGFMHWAAYGGNYYNILFAATLGLLFGIVTIRFRRGLIIAMAMHFTWNAYSLGFISLIGGP